MVKSFKIQHFIKIALLGLIFLSPVLNLPVRAQDKSKLPKDLRLPQDLRALFETKSQLFAHYEPLLVMKALRHSHLYKKKGAAHLERYIYFSEARLPYETILMDININGNGKKNRIIEANGTINKAHTLMFKDIIEFKKHKTAEVNLFSNIYTYNYLSLYSQIKYKEEKSKVLGYLFGYPVSYVTEDEKSTGTMLGEEYEVQFKNESKSGKFVMRYDGKIGTMAIAGYGHELKPDYYEIVEIIGDLVVKSYLKVKPED